MYRAIDECLQLLGTCEVPVRSRLIIESNLIGMKRVIQHDPFVSKKCEFFVKQHFETLLTTMRRVADEPGNTEVVPDIIAETSYLLIFLGVAGM
jgi:hypothetical protein